MNTHNPSEEEKSDSAQNLSRRNFLNGIAGAALAVAAVGAAAVTLEYLSPNVLYEPPTSFRIGSPEDFTLNSVTYFAEQAVYVVHEPAGFWAMSAICTHLGCITQWNADLDLIACPCHGSRFRKDGVVEHGPAPRPLPHFAIRFTPDGNLLVDKLETVPETQILKV